MGIEVTAIYNGNLRVTTTHGPSQSSFETDAPVDNCGKGERFSPTDLVGTAMGTCMLTIMGIYAQNHDINIDGATVRVLKAMTTELPRMIAKITTEITVPLPEDHPDRAAMETAALGCPVHRSLHPDVEKPVTFLWIG